MLKSNYPRTKAIKYFIVAPIIMVITLYFSNYKSFGQQNVAGSQDSLLNVLKTAQDDTNKVNTLNLLAKESMSSGNFEEAINYANEAKQIGLTINYKKGVANAFNNLGNINYYQSKYPDALINYFASLKLREEIEDKKGISASLSNIGVIYRLQRDFDRALEYYFKALKMDEVLGNKNGIARNLGNIGNIYNDKGNYPKALDYYFKALKMDELLENTDRIANHLGNIANVYQEQASGANPDSTIYREQLFSKALDYYFKALKITEESGDKNLMAVLLGSIGSVYSDTRKFSLAEDYLQRALVLLYGIGDLNYIMQVENSLYELYSKTGKPQFALDHYQKYIIVRDSIYNEENTKKQTRMEVNFEIEKNQLIKEQEEKEFAQKEKARITRRNILQYTLILLTILLVFGIIFSFGVVRISQPLATGFIFVAVLALFEFILVLTDPFIDKYTNGVPVYKLLVNTGLAILIFPLNLVLERKLKKRLNKFKK